MVCFTPLAAPAAKKLEQQGGLFMPITRRSMVAGAALAPFLAGNRRAHAQAWPSGTIKIIVPFPPGGTVDPIARLAQNGLQQRLGATIGLEKKSRGLGTAG